MITYLLNFVLCSGLLLLVYRLLLGNENLYRFNRFYLLFSLVFSLAVPLITMEIPAKISAMEQRLFASNTPPVETPILHQQTPADLTPVTFNQSTKEETAVVVTPVVDNTPIRQIAVEPQFNYKPYLLPAIYVLIALGMLIRFVRNLYFIKRSVSKTAIQTIDGAKLVLVDEDVTPHSFLTYVFVNRKAFGDGEIEPEIICHEQAHVRQLHSLDVLLVELFQAVCWFNPFIPLYRKSIQLNHEFLADEAVVKNYHDTSAYQYLLLAKASQQGSFFLTSQFNYSITKKRLIMMAKNTSPKIALYKRLALVPALACTVLLFSNKIIAQSKPEKAAGKTASVVKEQQVPGLPAEIKYNHKPIPASKTDAPQAVLDEFTAILTRYHQPVHNAAEGRLLRLNPFSQRDKMRLEVLFSQMSKAQQYFQYVDFFVPAPPLAKRHPTKTQLVNWQDTSKYRIWVDHQKIKNTGLSNYNPTDFDFFNFDGSLAPRNEKYHTPVVLWTKAIYSKFRDSILANHDWDIWHKLKKHPFGRLMSSRVPAGLSKSIGWAAANDEQRDTPQGLTGRLKFNHKPIPSAATDAPQSVLDEFAAIEKKYTPPAMNIVRKPYSDADKWRLESLYAQMSKQQQDAQVILFRVPPPPPVKSRPTAQQLIDWQDAAKYGVWIDDKRIKNNQLAKYKPSDFDHLFFSRLLPAAVKNDKFYFQVDLMTPPVYAQFLKEMQAKNDWDIYHKMKITNGTAQTTESGKGDAKNDKTDVKPNAFSARIDEKNEVSNADTQQFARVIFSKPSHFGGGLKTVTSQVKSSTVDLMIDSSNKTISSVLLRQYMHMIFTVNNAENHLDNAWGFEIKSFELNIDGKRCLPAELQKLKAADIYSINAIDQAGNTKPRPEDYYVLNIKTAKH